MYVQQLTSLSTQHDESTAAIVKAAFRIDIDRAYFLLLTVSWLVERCLACSNMS